MPSFCAQCGAALKPDARFCEECGVQLSEKVSTDVSSPKRTLLLVGLSLAVVVGAGIMFSVAGGLSGNGLVAFFTGASKGPLESSVRRGVESQLQRYGEVFDFRKMNGETREFMGMKQYLFYFRTAVKLKKGCYWATVTGQLKTEEEFQGFGGGLYAGLSGATPLPVGTTFVLEGHVVLRMTENGWVWEDWNRGRYGYCTTLGPDECYRELWAKESANTRTETKPVIAQAPDFAFPTLHGEKVKAARAQIEAFGTALDTFRLDVGRYPTLQEGLEALRQRPSGVNRWDGPYLKKEIPHDPWGNSYVYRSPGDGKPYELRSYGADGVTGGNGDGADIKS